MTWDPHKHLTFDCAMIYLTDATNEKKYSVYFIGSMYDRLIQIYEDGVLVKDYQAGRVHISARNAKREIAKYLQERKT